MRLDRPVAIGGARYDRYRMDTDAGPHQGGQPVPWPTLTRTTSPSAAPAPHELAAALPHASCVPRARSRCRGRTGRVRRSNRRPASSVEGARSSDDMSKTATLSAFHITKKNAPDGSDNVWSSGAGSRCIRDGSQGGELEGRADPPSQLDLALNYTPDGTWRSRVIPPRCRVQDAGLGSPDRWRRCGSNHYPGGKPEGMRGCRALRYGGGWRWMPPTLTHRTTLLMDMSAPTIPLPPQRKPEGDGVSLGASNLFNKTHHFPSDQNNCWFK